MDKFSNKQDCIAVTCKTLNQNNNAKKSPNQLSPENKKDESPTQEGDQSISCNLASQNENGSSSAIPPHSNIPFVSSSHIAYNNCPGVHNMNSTITPGGLTTTHYYSPILNTPQSLLRPLMTTQPPLYSPILPAQQHSYGLPHPSSSTGSFSNTSDSFKGMESVPCSEAVFKEASHLHTRSNSDISSDKACSVQSSRQFMSSDANQKRSNAQNSCSLSRFPACAEVVAKTNNFHDQHVFEEYFRMYGDDSGCRAWGTSDASSSNASLQSSTLHRNNSYANHHHQSGAGFNVHGYSDCRLDSSWNRYISGPGPSSSNSEIYSTEDAGSSANSKSLLKGFSLPGANNFNNSVTPPVSEHNLARAHLEYQAISAGQIASILSYMQPVNYQQQLEERNECRVSDSRSAESSCGGITNEVPTEHASLEAPKKRMPEMPSSSHVVSSSQHLTSSNSAQNPVSSDPLQSSAEDQLSILPHTLTTSDVNLSRIHASTNAVQTATTEFSTNGPLHPVSHKADHEAKKVSAAAADAQQSSQINPTPSCSGVANKFDAKTPSAVRALQDIGKKTANKEVNAAAAEDMNGNAAFCLLCGAAIEEPSSHSLIDSLITVPSKISVSDKLAMIIGYPLPREMLPSLSICPKCFHLINEVDVLEHRLKVCRREVLLSLESMFERNGIHFSPYKRLQRQQYVGSYQHHEMQHAAYQHLGTNVMAPQNNINGNTCYQNDSQNYQSLNPGFAVSNQNSAAQNSAMHQSQMYLTQNYHQHNIYLHSTAAQVNHHSQDPMVGAQRTPQEHHHHHHHLQNNHFNHNQSHHQQMHQHHVPLQEQQNKGQLIQHPLNNNNKIGQDTDHLRKHQQKQQQPTQEHHLMNQPHSSSQPLQLLQQQNTPHSNQQPLPAVMTQAHASHNAAPPELQAASQLQISDHKHQQAAAAAAFSNHQAHSSDSRQPIEAVHQKHYQENADLSLRHTSTNHTHAHMSKSDNDNSELLQGQFKYMQFQTKPNDDLTAPQKDDVANSVADTIIHGGSQASPLPPQNMQPKKDKMEPQEPSSLLLETNHHIPLILPENSDSLTSHPMSVLLSYQPSTERETINSGSIMNNFGSSYSSSTFNRNDAGVEHAQQMKTTIQEPVPTNITSSADISAAAKVRQNVDAETWSRCREPVIDSTNLNTSNNPSVAHAECDIDIEECDNMMDNVSGASHEQELTPPSCNQESQVEVEKVESVLSNQTSFEIEKEDGDIPCKETAYSSHSTHSNSVSSAARDLNILLPSPSSSSSSPPARPLGNAEGLRNVQDATEYHKPTLLGKNIKAKKHAKLQICRQCDQVFSNRQALIRHIERRHKSIACNYSCDTCHKKFNSERTLKQHTRTHKTYPCKICSKIFLKKNKLKKHLEEHSQQSLTCKTCSKVTGSMQALISHLKTHDRAPKAFICAVCSKTFTCKRNLNQHSLIHTGEKPFNCDNCGRGFRYRSNMVSHYSICVGKFRFICATCGKGFLLKSLYDRHSAEHEGRFAHKCSICQKGFGRSSDLRHHFGIHGAVAQTRSNLCSVCTTHSNSSSSSCNGNAKIKDTKTVCEICGKRVNRKETMKDHLSFHAGKRHHECHLCSMSYFYKSNLTFHIKTAHFKKFPFPCAICRKAFSRPANYQLHMRTHTGERPYQCKSCGKAFTSSSNYKRHLKCHVTHPLVADDKQNEVG